LIKIIKTTLTLSLLYIASAQATHTCLTSITTLDIQPNGDIAVSGDNLGGSNQICSVVTTANSIHTETCKVLYSALSLAFAADKKVRFYFNNDANTSCSKGNWKDLNTHGFYYLRIEKES
jgi:hypothetical protein